MPIPGFFVCLFLNELFLIGGKILAGQNFTSFSQFSIPPVFYHLHSPSLFSVWILFQCYVVTIIETLSAYPFN